MSDLVCIQDFEKFAFDHLTPAIRDFCKGGAGEENTLRWNREAFRRIKIRPRMLRNVAKRDISTTVLGHKVSMPLGISPTGMQRMAHPDGECANARSAEAFDTVYTLSTMSTCSIEEVAAAAPNALKWFQLYIYSDRDITLNLVRRAERAGFKALVLTVDTPVFGERWHDRRNKFTLPSHLKLGNFESLTSDTGITKIDQGLNDYVGKLFDPSLSWKDVEWLKSITKLPIVLKGILTAEDAILGVKHGASAIWVSNHGARQVDTAPATIEALPEVVRAVNGKVEVYLDGGVTQGTDVFKALALGAKMVFIGRPMIWGLTHGGEEGAKAVLKIMRNEIDNVIALTGCRSVRDVTSDMVVHESYYSRL